MLTSVRLHNYLGFVNSEVHLGRVNFLFGKNGSGKTTFLNALHVLIMTILEGNIEDSFTASTQFRFATFPNQSFALDATIDGSQYTYYLDLSYTSSDSPPQVKREELTCNGNRLFLLADGVINLHDDLGQQKATFPFGSLRGGLAFVDKRKENRLLNRFKDWAQAFLLARLDPASMLSEAKRPALSLDCDAQNFVAWYETVSNADAADSYDFLKLMREVLPGLREVSRVLCKPFLFC